MNPFYCPEKEEIGRQRNTSEILSIDIVKEK